MAKNPTTAAKPVHRFQVLAGRYRDGDGVVHEKDSIVESTMELDKLHVNKFLRLGESRPAPAPSDAPGEVTDKTPETNQPPEEADPRGEDVSDAYPNKKGLSVFHREGTVNAGGGFFVYNGETLVNPTKNGLGSAKTVTEFVAKYTA